MTSSPSSPPRPLEHLGRPALSAEARLVFATAAGSERADEVRALVGEVRSWRRALELSAWLGAQPVFGQVLRDAAPDELPTDLLGALRPMELLARHRQSYLLQRATEAVETLTAAGISVVLLKGAALGITTYASPADRPMRDLDLLVHPEQALEAQALLSRSGWTPRYAASYDEWYVKHHHHLPPLADARAPKLGVGLELHTDIASPRHNPFVFKAADVWRDAVPAPGMTQGALVPSEAHRLVHCCVHFAWSHRMQDGGWRSFHDVAAMLRAGQLDAAMVAAAARAAGAEAPMFWTLRLARDVGRVDVPDAVLDGVASWWPAPVVRRFVRHFAQELVPSERLCPSIRVRRTLWMLALRARVAGHAMLETDEWHGPKQPDDRRDSGDAGRREDGHRLSAWRKYLASVA